MHKQMFSFTVNAESHHEANAAAQALADKLRGAEGVDEVERLKADPTTMDVGTILQVIVGSGSTLAIAQGVAAWLRGRRGVKLRIERDGKSGSLKAEVEGIDPTAAMRIVEMVRDG